MKTFNEVKELVKEMDLVAINTEIIDIPMNDATKARINIITNNIITTLDSKNEITIKDANDILVSAKNIVNVYEKNVIDLMKLPFNIYKNLNNFYIVSKEILEECK